jgi:hypothetical protein
MIIYDPFGFYQYKFCNEVLIGLHVTLPDQYVYDSKNREIIKHLLELSSVRYGVRANVLIFRPTSVDITYNVVARYYNISSICNNILF